MQNESLKDVLNNFVGKILQKENYYFKLGTATDIEGFTFTFTPNDETPTLEEVPVSIQGSEEEAIVIVPKENSLVLVAFTDKETPYCLWVSEAEKIYLNAPETVFNGGENGGLINITDLVSRYNDLEGLHNQLQLDFTNWVPVPQDGGAALKTILSAGYLTKSVPNSKREDFEDDKVTH